MFNREIFCQDSLASDVKIADALARSCEKKSII